MTVYLFFTNLFLSGQQRLYHEIAKLDFIQTICDSGLDPGLSAFTWLNSNPRTKLYAFEAGKQSYSNAVYDILNKMFPGRILLTTRDSTKTLTTFQRNHPEIKCNLIVIPNRHKEKTEPHLGLNHFANMVNRTYPYNIILVEDWMGKSYKVGSSMPGRHLRPYKAKEVFRCTNAILTKTIVIGWYP